MGFNPKPSDPKAVSLSAQPIGRVIAGFKCITGVLNLSLRGWSWFRSVLCLISVLYSRILNFRRPYQFHAYASSRNYFIYCTCYTLHQDIRLIQVGYSQTISNGPTQSVKKYGIKLRAQTNTLVKC